MVQWHEFHSGISSNPIQCLWKLLLRKVDSTYSTVKKLNEITVPCLHDQLEASWMRLSVTRITSQINVSKEQQPHGRRHNTPQASHSIAGFIHVAT